MLRPLPRVVAPFRDETITSYLHRLAGPNHIDPAGLRSWLARKRPQGRAGAARPARRRHRDALPVAGLRHAADLHRRRTVRPAHARTGHAPGHGWAFPACRACAAGQPVTRWALHDDVICYRHRRWISKDHEQPDLTGQPEILHAYRRHRRLIRRHGRDPVMRALRDAQHICIGWRLDGLRDPGFDRRMEIFRGPGWDDPDEWAPQAFDAATYPQSVALARLLASPYWRERILGTDWAGHDEFTAELRRTVAPDYTWDYRPYTRWRRDRDDPLLEWRLDTRRLKLEPLPPGHAWNLPETIQRRTAADATSHRARRKRRVTQVGGTIRLRQTVPSTEPRSSYGRQMTQIAWDRTATARTVSTSITGTTAGTALFTRPAPGVGAGGLARI